MPFLERTGKGDTRVTTPKNHVTLFRVTRVTCQDTVFFGGRHPPDIADKNTIG